MKVTVNRAELLKAVTACARAVSTKTSLPILSTMLLVIEKGRLLVTGTDLELTVQASVTLDTAAEIEVGQAAVPSETLMSLTKGMTGERVSLTLDDAGKTLLVKAGRSKYNVPVLAAVEYPPAPQVEQGKGFEVEGKILAETLGRILNACSADNSRPVICGTSWEVEGEKLTLVGTDTHRLHIAGAPVSGALGGKLAFVLPRHASDELAKLLNDDACTVTVGANAVEICSTWGIFTSRLVEGQYVNYGRVVPNNCDKLLMVNREELVAAVKRAGIVAEGNANRIRMEINEEGALAITAHSEEHGAADEVVEVASQKGEFEPMAVNWKFLQQTAAVVPDEMIYLKTSQPLNPMLVHGSEKGVFQAIVMPMQME